VREPHSHILLAAVAIRSFAKIFQKISLRTSLNLYKMRFKRF